MPYICAAIMEDDLKTAVKKASKVSSDIVELRLDLVGSDSDLHLIKKIKKPVIATCMPLWEGGCFEGSEDERTLLLLKALDYVDYVTVELNMGGSSRSALISSAKARGIKVIVAHHDFKKTPEFTEIADVLKRERHVGADIAKIAYMPKKIDDVLNVLSAQALSDIGIPIIALSMGELGRFSRVVGPMLGGFISFAQSGDKCTAPGQYSISEMKKIKRILWR
ncbi:MAG: type I 3-dehydroquinate dehydratase [Candidatus Altiarchaeota archaeon]|nr:type I 3-dehydroquinate dehydratase [Candidatus Altiarchaeota archaeon]